MTTHYILGNGQSLRDLTLTDLRTLSASGEVWMVNRAWRLFEDLPRASRWDAWRPDHYARCEVPSYDPKHVQEDLLEMSPAGATMWLEEGFKGYVLGEVLGAANPHTTFEFFQTCGTDHAHPWHLPLICGYGTVVNVAMQLAVSRRNASKIWLYGCDLGLPMHFYGLEGDRNDDLSKAAHKVASECCPVPVYTATRALTDFYSPWEPIAS